MTGNTLGRHWDAVYADGDATASWTQAHPTRSLDAIGAIAPDLNAPIIDVGGGSSTLAGALLTAGHTDVTVLDLSASALGIAQERLGDQADRLQWIAADLLRWKPTRRYAIWHDRAVLHFFTEPADRAQYAATLLDALRPGGHAVIATFALDGPNRCSGLPVRRSSAENVLRLLGDEFAGVSAAIEHHRTPSGRLQPFSWLVACRSRAAGQDALRAEKAESGCH